MSYCKMSRRDVRQCSPVHKRPHICQTQVFAMAGHITIKDNKGTFNFMQMVLCNFVHI